MNAQIQELKEQAMRFAQEKCEGKSRDMYGALRADIMTEKFAELIVEECAEICMKEIDTGLLMAPQAPWIAKQIKQHFGVEE